MENFKEAFINVNQVPTKVTTIGKALGDSFKDSENLVIIVPGNPGVNSFYDQFARNMYKNLNCTVWCIGHAGHNLGTNTIASLPKFEKNKELYGLKGQVQHKVDFFEKYIPKNIRVYLIGHSIGSYMILEMLENPNIAKRVKHSYLLFPTIEYMATTKNGKFLINFVKPIVWLTLLLSFLFTCFPNFFQNFLIHIYMYVVGVSTHNCDIIKQLIKPGVLKRVFFLAFEEMDQVLQRNDNSIKSNVNKIKLFYGKTDGWTPLTYYENIKQDYPEIEAEVTNINHAFVLNRSLEISDIVSNWISDS